MIALVLDHLWQSSIFLAGVGLTTLLLARNSAAARFWLWFSASIKFLLPFAALTTLGSFVLTAIVPPLSAPNVARMEPLAQPFSDPIFVAGPAVQAMTPPSLASLLPVVWALGFAAIALRWLMRWMRLRALLREAVDAGITAPVAVKFSSSRLEPGLVGIFKPAILLPQGIAGQLTAAELTAILAHELCHWRRHDNLLAAIHMAVEAIFWFFPPIWWLGARLNAERERACDESVLATGNDPEIYAGSILKVCRAYLQSPIACVSGVSGAGLKQRMDMIIENRIAARLNVGMKTLLTAGAVLAVTAPLALGLISPGAVAQTDVVRTTAGPGTEAALRHQIEGWEKKMPAIEALTEPMVAATHQQQAAIQSSIDEYGPLKSITFDSVDARGWDVYVVMFQNAKTVWHIAPLRPDGKVGGLVFMKAIARDGTNTPSPGTEVAVRHVIDGLQAGQPPYDLMMPQLVIATRQQLAGLEAGAKALGALKSLNFKWVTPQGWDAYEGVYEHGRAAWSIAPLVDGKIDSLLVTDIHTDTPAHPGTEASLRLYIESLEKGQPNYDAMVPAMADAVRRQLPDILAVFKPLGALKTMTFQGGGPMGTDVYRATFEHGTVEWTIAPLTAGGKVERRSFRLVD
jgi:beta-lactamase regulating signal transducer with metallopeptidase domain